MSLAFTTPVWVDQNANNYSDLQDYEYYIEYPDPKATYLQTTLMIAIDLQEKKIKFYVDSTLELYTILYF